MPGRAAADGDYKADRSTYQRVIDYTRKNRDRMEMEWAEVTRRYARLQIEAVS